TTSLLRPKPRAGDPPALLSTAKLCIAATTPLRRRLDSSAATSFACPTGAPHAAVSYPAVPHPFPPACSSHQAFLLARHCRVGGHWPESRECLIRRPAPS